ncbi:MAG: GNAT family N-acetyltransferase, partial [Chitinophagales bacterium]
KDKLPRYEKNSMIQFILIHPTLDQNAEFLNHPICKDGIHASIEYYKTVGFNPPWVGYFVKMNNDFVGSAGYKGKPVNHKIEIAYGTFPEFQRRGVATAICREMVNLALETDPSLIISARTLPEFNYSTKVLMKNGFKFSGAVWDKDDGEVWEWIYPTH